MDLHLTRSQSVNQSSGQSVHPQVIRSVSYRQICKNESQSSDALPDLHDLKNCLADAKAQIDAFVKEYPHNWNIGNTYILIRYKDAVKRLPEIEAQLSSNELKKMPFVENILKNMKANLIKSLKWSARNDTILSSYLERAEHETANAVLLSVNTASDLHFDKDLNSANDIMSAAMIVQRYFTDIVNKTTTRVH